MLGYVPSEKLSLPGIVAECMDVWFTDSATKYRVCEK